MFYTSIRTFSLTIGLGWKAVDNLASIRSRLQRRFYTSDINWVPLSDIKDLYGPWYFQIVAFCSFFGFLSNGGDQMPYLSKAINEDKDEFIYNSYKRARL